MASDYQHISLRLYSSTIGFDKFAEVPLIGAIELQDTDLDRTATTDSIVNSTISLITTDFNASAPKRRVRKGKTPRRLNMKIYQETASTDFTTCKRPR